MKEAPKTTRIVPRPLMEFVNGRVRLLDPELTYADETVEEFLLYTHVQERTAGQHGGWTYFYAVGPTPSWGASRHNDQLVESISPIMRRTPERARDDMAAFWKQEGIDGEPKECP